MFVAFDPGVTTGIAVVDDNGNVVVTYAMREANGVEIIARELHSAYPDADVVAEQPPQYAGHYRAHTQGIEKVLTSIFPDLDWATPSQWKGTPASRPPSPLRNLTQHEKDAVGLARWLRSQRRQGVRRGT